MGAVNGCGNISNGITQTITQITQNHYSNLSREEMGNKKPSLN
ncbi:MULTISPECIES: hypothetical protein [Nitrosomonas]|uniref:Uncharacterized protein n=1 Tax=Nitrosomonas communis TaxID=44574 RepID=A0A5D3YAL6_9PROT|nr:MULTISPECIES: hypothetical protein [Nitrosomonas]TYP78471.1 hypothetical protein BCL69_10723 [Nitrosomonas communis]UVS62813.1 hypothetical protein NX761_06815 [Nitrosomonas sp. PLL12]